MNSYAETEPPPENPIELTAVIHGGGPEIVMSDIWMDEVEKRTNGMVHFTRNYHSEPSETEIADAGHDCPAGGGRYHLLDMIQTPFIFPSATVGSKAIAQLYAESPELRDELSEVKIVGLGIGALMAICASKDWGPIRTLEDLKGARIRSLLPIDKVFETVEAKPMHISPFKLDQNFAAGELDAAVIGLTLAAALKLVEQAPYYTICGSSSITMHPMRTFMKWDTWNRLPPDIQKIIDKLGPTGRDCWFAVQNGFTFDNTLTKARKDIMESGGEIITLAPEELERWSKVAQPVRESAVNAVEGMGLPGRKFLKRMLELVEEYSD